MEPTDWQPTEARWASLRYYSLYRVIAAASLAIIGRTFMAEAQEGWSWIVAAYFLVAVTLLYFHRLPRLSIDRVVNLHMAVDLLAFSLLMYFGGGLRGGLPYMLMVVVAAGGLFGEGRLVFFYAAVASLGVLGVEGTLAIRADRDVWNSMAVAGFVSTGFFAVATVSQLLARRALYNEQLAFRRGSELARQERLNARIIADLQDGVLVVDGAGVLRHFNRRAETMLGATIHLGQALDELAPQLAEALRSGQHEAVHGVEQQRLRIRALDAGEGLRLLYLEDLERIEREAQQIKLAALGRLTGSIAHEIRNPLAAISHASELLGEEKRADMQARLTRIIHDNTQRIDRMVRDVLELGRRDRVTQEWLDLDAFVGTFLDDMATYEGLDPQVVVYSGLPGVKIRFDRVHLHQVLWNLVGNARRYCSGTPAAVHIVASAGLQQGEILLSVQDDGPGVPPALRPRVFEPFFTTDSRGTGLGLFIARELAMANDGRLELDESGGGFRLMAGGQT